MDTDKIKTNLKKIFSNPNTFTFILVMLLIVVVYFVYNYMVNKAISPVNLPYTNTLIKSDTEITNDMISVAKVSGTFVSTVGGNLIQNRGQLIEHRVAEGYQIPKNSFFYKDAISSEKNTGTNSYFYDIPDGYTIYALKVSFHSTYGCSIMPGNYIDLYVKTIDNDGKIVFSLFIKSIQVYNVLDKNFIDVFSYTDEESDELDPSYMYFAVPIEYYELLKKAELIGGITLIPVPRNAGYSENPEETIIANEAIENFILAKSVSVTN